MIELDKSLSTIVDKLNELVASNSGDAINLALTMTKMDCVQSIITMVMFAILSVVTYKCASYCLAKGMEEEAITKKERRYCDDSGSYYFIAGITGLFSAIFTLIALLMLTDVYMWIGLVDPKIALAKKIMLTVLK